MLKQFVFVIISLCWCCTLNAQDICHIDDHTKNVIDSTYKSLLKKNKVVGASLAIVDSGRIVYATGYGFSDHENAIEADAQTVYRIGSCSKSFTALSLMQLMDASHLNIHASIMQYIPELAIKSRFNDNNKLYITDILTHTSGLPGDILNGFFCDAPPDEIWVINELNKQYTVAPARYKHAYSNIGFGLLGEVIARQSDQTYGQYVLDNVFLPIGMTNSYIDLDTAISKYFSKGYIGKDLVTEPLIRDQGAGMVHSNVLDMGKYLLMYLNKGNVEGQQIVSEKSIMDMEADHLKGVTLSSGQHWGYGLYSSNMKIKNSGDSSVVTVIGHGGDTFAYHADFGFINELGVGAVVLTNTDNGVEINNAAKLLKLYLEQTRKDTITLGYLLPEDTMPIMGEEPCTLDEIKGIYNFGQFCVDMTKGNTAKFKQGPAVIHFVELKDNPLHFEMKVKLFGLIPFKIKNQEFRFVKYQGQVYMKDRNPKKHNEDYMAVRTDPTPVSTAWNARLGDYKPVNKVYECKDCPFMNMEGLTMQLEVKKGILVLATKAKTDDMNSDLYLNIISDTLSVGGGIGRGTGDSVIAMDNGHIYYSGIEFEKVK